MADDDDVYLRRVKDPNPLLEELARQACDQLERWSRVQPFTIARAAANFGVPIDYVLDERERRVRARRTPEKGESS